MSDASQAKNGRRTYSCESAIGDAIGQHQEEEHPYLKIRESFLYLSPFDFVVDPAILVTLQTINGDLSFGLGEKSSRLRGVGEEEANDNTPYDGNYCVE